MSQQNLPPLDPLIEGYFRYLATVGRKRPRTIIDVRCSVRRAVDQLAVIRPGVDLWHVSLEDFLHWFEAERQRGATPSTLAKHASHLRGLLEYCWRSGRAERNVLDGFSLQHTLRPKAPRSLTLEEAARLVEATAVAGRAARRDREVMLIQYGCGQRTSALWALDVAHVNRERRELLIARAKNDRPRIVPIPDALYTELLAYLLERGKRGPLFRTSVKKRRISAKEVCAVVTAAVERAGLDASVTARTLRHSFATHLMDRGVDLAIIASLMGHRSPQETGVYLHVLPGRPQAAVRTLPIGERP